MGSGSALGDESGGPGANPRDIDFEFSHEISLGFLLLNDVMRGNVARLTDGDVVGAPWVLAAHFLVLAAQKLGKPALRLTKSDVRILEQHDWPGNVRELASAIERAAILARGGRLALDAVLPQPNPGSSSRAPLRAELSPLLPAAVESEIDRKQQARMNIERALASSGGKLYGKGGAAEILGIPATTLASRVKALGIRR